MSATLIAIVGIIYAGVCVSQLSQGNMGMAIVFGSYALGNVGFVMATW